MKKFLKKALSIALALALMLSVLQLDCLSLLAQLKDFTLTTVADASNAINRLSMTDTQSVCEHDYQFYSSTGKPTCTNKASVKYKCSICGIVKNTYSALGHMYRITGTRYRACTYSCEYCSGKFTFGVEEPMAQFEANINKPANRYNGNSMIDVVNDGIINVKDFAMLKKMLKYELINKNADDTTKRVYQYLCSINGKQTLSAQQESTWKGSADYEMNYIYKASKKYPAMRGLDYMNDDFAGVNSRAIDWWRKGGLVTICWHTGSDFCGEWNDAMNDNVSNWSAMLTEGTAQYDAMIAGMDKAAQALKQLQDAGVTVLWRPFHEFDGAWFWWGKGGAANFKKMWQIMYDRYTNYWGLNNLIWVLGYSHNGTDINSWYVGDDYYDIIGADSYDTAEIPGLYTKISQVAANGKPICLHECGTNLTADEMSSMPWCYFMTWHTEYLTDSNDKSSINALYNSDRVITLDEVSY